MRRTLAGMRMSLGALSIAEAAAHIREGRITARPSSSATVSSASMRSMPRCRPGPFSIATTRCARPRRSTTIARQGRALGPLHGVPVGIKDIFDTGDMPTEFGSPLWAGRTPRQRRRGGRATARGRRRDHGQDRDHRIRLLSSRQDAQPARSRTHARRLLERLGGGGRCRHGAGRDRHRRPTAR